VEGGVVLEMCSIDRLGVMIRESTIAFAKVKIRVEGEGGGGKVGPACTSRTTQSLVEGIESCDQWRETMNMKSSRLCSLGLLGPTRVSGPSQTPLEQNFVSQLRPMYLQYLERDYIQPRIIDP